MIISTLFQMLPIILVVLGGFLLSSIESVKVEDLVRIVSDFFMPALVFISLTESSLSGAVIGDIAKASALVSLLLFPLALGWAKLAKQDMRSTIPPLVFMNSGFLGIPLMELWGGSEAMNLILIYDQIQGIFLFTLGLLIITGGFSRKGLLNMLHSPILWAVLLGFLVRMLPITMPKAIVSTFTFAGSAASPLAAFTLGVSLKRIRFTFDRHIIGGLAIRFIGGYAVGYLAASIVGLSGLSKTVVIVATALPSAVFTSVLPLRYGLKNEFSSTMVLVSSLMGIFTIPITIALAS
jgi:predicted permease